MLIKLLILSIISGILYRLGGIGKPFKTWMRDWTIPALFLFTLHMLYKPTIDLKLYLIYLITYILMGASLTTYWDTMLKEDNFYAHGFCIGLSTLPLIWLGIHWYIIMIYSVLLALLMGLWSKIISNAFWEEFGRGFLICLLLRIFATK